MSYEHIKSALRVIDVAMTEDRLTAHQARLMVTTIDGATAHDIEYCLSHENLEAIRKNAKDDRRRQNRLRVKREASVASLRRAKKPDGCDDLGRTLGKLILFFVLALPGCNTFNAQPAGYVDKHPNLLRDRHHAVPLWTTRYDSHHCQRKNHRQCDH